MAILGKRMTGGLQSGLPSTSLNQKKTEGYCFIKAISIWKKEHKASDNCCTCFIIILFSCRAADGLSDSLRANVDSLVWPPSWQYVWYYVSVHDMECVQRLVEVLWTIWIYFLCICIKYCLYSSQDSTHLWCMACCHGDTSLGCHGSSKQGTLLLSVTLFQYRSNDNNVYYLGEPHPRIAQRASVVYIFRHVTSQFMVP